MTVPSPPPALKQLGQHFLIDPNIVRKILDEASVNSEETVFEIGPGRGVLTEPLCQVASQVIAIEFDNKLATYLTSICSPANLDLRIGDALEFPFHTLPLNTVVVSNLPYYISTPLLFKLLEHRYRISRMVLMLQLEVAKRITAKPGSRDYGTLSVLIQYCANSRLAFKVPAECFRPRPDVDSSVITLNLYPKKNVDPSFDKDFIWTVRAAFAHRRKTLFNSFRDSGLAVGVIHESLAAVDIDAKRRAETLTVLDFVNLTHAIRRHTI